MKRLLFEIAKAALLGALIGAVAAIFTPNLALRDLAAGAIIGLVIGASFGLRIALHRAPSAGAGSISDQELAKRDKLIGQIELSERMRSAWRPGNRK